jgi:hypothetical protein
MRNPRRIVPVIISSGLSSVYICANSRVNRNTLYVRVHPSLDRENWEAISAEAEAQGVEAARLDAPVYNAPTISLADSPLRFALPRIHYYFHTILGSMYEYRTPPEDRVRGWFKDLGRYKEGNMIKIGEEVYLI